MKLITTCLLIILLVGNSLAQNVFRDDEGIAYVHSGISGDEIASINNQVKGGINVKNGRVAFVMALSGFKFRNSQTEKMLSNYYLEFDKYPRVLFKGQITYPDNNMNLNQPGSYSAEVVGEIEFHGVRKEIVTEIFFVVSSSGLAANATFDLSIDEFGISKKNMPTEITPDLEIRTSFIF
ncbi:MAG: YceI family protein [Bacteroidota bacterium]